MELKIFGDPKVFGNAKEQNWGRLLFSGRRPLRYGTSPDFKEWNKSSEFAERKRSTWAALMECLDLFPLKN